MAKLLTRHVCLWAAFRLLAALAFVAQQARAAVTEAWVQRYSNVTSNSTDTASKIVCDTAGDIIVAGSTFGDSTNGPDMLTIKYSGADGSVLWQKHDNGVAYAAAVDDGGNVVVTGYSGNETNVDYYTAKYAAADGALLWEKRYNGRGNDFANAVGVDASGNVVATGNSYGSGSGLDWYTAKYAAANGALLWRLLFQHRCCFGSGRGRQCDRGRSLRQL